jgi:hypothetical protein
MGIGDEDWKVLRSLFPKGWEAAAEKSGALTRMRGFESAEALLRTILLHVARGYSLRETVVQARAVQLANVSDVALLKRLRNSEDWLRSLCVSLLDESGVVINHLGGRSVRLVDGTIVREPGKTGSLWRLLYCLQLPTLLCDFFDLTTRQGIGNGESLTRIPMQPGDLILADAGYCRPPSIDHVVRHRADVIVRVNWATLPISQSGSGSRDSLLDLLRQLDKPGQAGDWGVSLLGRDGPIAGRVCALLKTQKAIQTSQGKVRRRASKSMKEMRPETLEYAKYVTVFTTWKEATAAQILDWYRVRWQIELAFRRLKSLAQLGHLPKYDEASSRAWLYGKLFVALLSQKLMRVGRDISPWGYAFISAAE